MNPARSTYPQAFEMDTSASAAVYKAEEDEMNVVVYCGIDKLGLTTHIGAIIALQDAEGGYAVRYGSRKDAEKAIAVHHACGGYYEIADCTVAGINEKIRHEISKVRLETLRARLIDGPAPALVPVTVPAPMAFVDTATMLSLMAPPAPFAPAPFISRVPATPAKAASRFRLEQTESSPSLSSRPYSGGSKKSTGFEKAGTPSSRSIGSPAGALANATLTDGGALAAVSNALTGGPDCPCLTGTAGAVEQKQQGRVFLSKSHNWRPSGSWTPPNAVTPPIGTQRGWMPLCDVGTGPWFVVNMGRAIGVYSDLDDAITANGGSSHWLKHLRFDNFGAALEDWFGRCDRADFVLVLKHTH